VFSLSRFGLISNSLGCRATVRLVAIPARTKTFFADQSADVMMHAIHDNRAIIDILSGHVKPVLTAANFLSSKDIRSIQPNFGTMGTSRGHSDGAGIGDLSTMLADLQQLLRSRGL
jgi:hypothetical protein